MFRVTLVIRRFAARAVGEGGRGEGGRGSPFLLSDETIEAVACSRGSQGSEVGEQSPPIAVRQVETVDVSRYRARAVEPIHECAAQTFRVQESVRRGHRAVMEQRTA